MYKFDDVKTHIRARLESGELIGFFGAGLGIRAGLPSWRSLLEQVAKKTVPAVDLPFVETKLNSLFATGEYLTAADFLRVYVQEKLGEHVAHVIRTTPVEVQRISTIALIPFSRIITTNYDKLIEKAHAQVHSNPISSFHNTQDEIEDFGACQDPCVLHLHGSIDHPRSIVIDSISYQKYAQTEHYQAALRTMLASQPFLFVGFSFDDPQLKLFVDYCTKYLKFLVTHESYAFLVKGAASKEALNALSSANIKPVTFENYEQLWAAIDELKFSVDDYSMIAAKNSSALPALHLFKNKLGIAFSATQLQLQNKELDFQSRLVSAIILNVLMPLLPTKLVDIENEVASTLVVNDETARKLTGASMEFLTRTGRIKPEADGYIVSQELSSRSFEEGIDEFLKSCLRFFETISERSLDFPVERLKEFLISAVETNATLMGNHTRLATVQFPQLGTLLRSFLTTHELPKADDIEKAIRLGLKNISIQHAKCLASLAQAAYAFQVSFFNSKEVFSVMPDTVREVLVDSNVLLPILAPGSTEAGLNTQVLNSLRTQGKQLTITTGVVQEIVNHLKIAVEEYEKLGKDDATFSLSIFLASSYEVNAFQSAFAQFRERSRDRFDKYIREQVGWRTEDQLRKKLESMGFTILPKLRKYEEVEQIKAELKPQLGVDDKKAKIAVILEHDAEMVYLAGSSENKTAVLTYDYKLMKLCRGSRTLRNMTHLIFNPVQVASMLDSENLPEMDCKAYLRRLLPAGEASVQEVVQSHYLSLLMNGHERIKLEDAQKILSKVTDALRDIANQKAISSKDKAFANIHEAMQIIDFVDPKFMKLAEELNTLKRS